MSCEPYSSSVVKLVRGAYRLVTPMVSRLSSQHFGCHLETDLFGPVLQTLVFLLLLLLLLRPWQVTEGEWIKLAFSTEATLGLSYTIL